MCAANREWNGPQSLRDQGEVVMLCKGKAIWGHTLSLINDLKKKNKPPWRFTHYICFASNLRFERRRITAGKCNRGADAMHMNRWVIRTPLSPLTLGSFPRLCFTPWSRRDVEFFSTPFHFFFFTSLMYNRRCTYHKEDAKKRYGVRDRRSKKVTGCNALKVHEWAQSFTMHLWYKIKEAKLKLLQWVRAKRVQRYGSKFIISWKKNCSETCGAPGFTSSMY